MARTDIDQFNSFPTQFDRQPIRKRDLRNRSGPFLANNCTFCVFMRDDGRRIGKDLSTGDMIGVIVTVDEIFDR
jgi:hypothetical protein